MNKTNSFMSECPQIDSICINNVYGIVLVFKIPKIQTDLSLFCIATKARFLQVFTQSITKHFKTAKLGMKGARSAKASLVPAANWASQPERPTSNTVFASYTVVI